jgi:hypothetical protein
MYVAQLPRAFAPRPGRNPHECRHSAGFRTRHSRVPMASAVDAVNSQKLLNGGSFLEKRYIQVVKY